MPQTGNNRIRPILKSHRRYASSEKIKRYSHFITPAIIIKKLNEEGCRISDATFLKLMLDKNLFMMQKRGKRWIATPYEARLIVELVKEWYGIKSIFDDPDPE